MIHDGWKPHEWHISGNDAKPTTLLTISVLNEFKASVMQVSDRRQYIGWWVNAQADALR